jgi:hypothetical protein
MVKPGFWAKTMSLADFCMGQRHAGTKVELGVVERSDFQIQILLDN